MALSITSGVSHRPSATLIYGPEGVGKTTLASLWPKPLIFDLEEGSLRLAGVQRVLGLNTIADFYAALDEFVRTKGVNGQYQTIVIDTLDRLERMLTADLLATKGWKSIEDPGYGKGWVQLAEKVNELIARLEKVVNAGFYLVLVGHSKVQRVEPPDAAAPYDRFELKLAKQNGPLFMEWAESVLFLNYYTLVMKEEGKSKAVGGKERRIYTERSAAHSAKCRFPVPDVIKYLEHRVPAELAPLFNGASPAPAAAPAPAAPAAPPAPAPAPETPTRRPRGSKAAAAAPAPAEAPPPAPAPAPAPTPEPEPQPDAPEPAAEAPEPAAEAPEPAIPEAAHLAPELLQLAEIFKGHETAIDAFLLARGRIKAGQTWLDIPIDYAQKILADAPKFLKAVGVK